MTTAAAEAPVTPARVVLDAHSDLRARLARPDRNTRQYFTSFMEDIARKAEASGDEKHVVSTLGHMFYPAPDADGVIAQLAAGLFSARTFQVTAEMMTAVTGTYENSTGHVAHLTERELPAESGFTWFDTPLLFPDVHGKTIAIRAVSWSPVPIRFRDETVPGLRLTSWCHIDDPDDFFAEATRDRRLLSLGPLTMSHSQIILIGQRFGGPDQEGWPEYAGRPDDLISWMHTLWMFMDAEITISRQAVIDRGTRKRASRSLGRDQQVSVVLLRRHRAVGEPSGGHAQIDWSCRWVVQGFYRHLETYLGEHHHAIPGPRERGHCLACGARLTWVRPHLRGPEDKPLRSADQLYRLAR